MAEADPEHLARPPTPNSWGAIAQYGWELPENPKCSSKKQQPQSVALFKNKVCKRSNIKPIWAKKLEPITEYWGEEREREKN